jgi:predicted  nucleic acid-binding Zn-ribbon protein
LRIQNSINLRIKQLKGEANDLRLAKEKYSAYQKLAKDKHSSLRKQHENNSKQIYQREQDIVENWQILANYLPNNSIDLKNLNPSVEYPNSKDL